MAVTLAEAQVNTQDDVDYAVIDETRRRSWLLDQIQFDDAVAPGTAGATLTYGYTRLATPAAAAFRALNTEYGTSEAVRQRLSVDLSPLGGSFNVDRVLANLGARRTNEVAFQMSEVIKSTRTRFQDEVINGAQTVDSSGTDAQGSPVGFDGLDTSLAGSDTEVFPEGGATESFDWTAGAITGEGPAHDALDVLDELVAKIEGGAQAILGNERSMIRLRSIARRAGYYSREEDALGRTVERFGNAVLIDLGYNTDGSAPIIPIASTDLDASGILDPDEQNLTSIYAVRFGMDAFHGVSVSGSPLVRTWTPDFDTAGAVKPGEVEMGPLAMVLKATRAAAVLRNVKVQ